MHVIEVQELHCLCSSLRAKHEHASLLEDFWEFDRTRLDLEGVGSPEQALMKEHVSISQSTGHVCPFKLLISKDVIQK